MSKLNEIENKLGELDGGAYQKLVDAYLVKDGYRNLVPVGSVIGRNKVATGTPDSLNPEDDGTYTFFEHTTMGGPKLRKKLLDDLDKCANPRKTGVPLARIREVVFSVSSKLSAKTIAALRARAEGHGLKVRLLALQTLALNLLTKYPVLAREFLEVPVDTGQITTTDEFISRSQRNKLATPLDTALVGRQREIQLALEALRSAKVVVLAGNPGVGKSRLALECLTRFTNENPGWRPYCVEDRGVDAFDDIRGYFGPSGKYVILADDANRGSAFDYLVKHVIDAREDQEFKIIATVRRYAKPGVVRTAEQLSRPEVLDVVRLTDSEIDTLLTNCFVASPSKLLQERFRNLARGNPRIAMMVGAVLKEEQNWESIQNIEKLYEQYFGRIRDHLFAKERRLMKVAAILGFLRVVDSSDQGQLAKLEATFRIDKHDFWTLVQQLVEYELVDIHEGRIARISDQIFATYAFYRACFVEQSIDFGSLFDEYFAFRTSQIVEVLHPCLEAFDQQAILKATTPVLERAWRRYIQQDDRPSLYALMKHHPFELRTAVLAYLQRIINKLPREEVLTSSAVGSFSRVPPVLEILGGFCDCHEAERAIALELMLDYLQKVPGAAESVRQVILGRFGMRHYSHELDFSVQANVLDAMTAALSKYPSDAMANLYLSIATEYLRFEFHSDIVGRDDTFRSIGFSLGESRSWRRLRNGLIDKLFETVARLGLHRELTAFLDQYTRSLSRSVPSAVIGEDAKRIGAGLGRVVPVDHLALRAESNRYLDRLSRIGIAVDEDVRSQLSHPELALIKAIFHRPRDLDDSYEAIEQQRRERLLTLIDNYSATDFVHLVEVCARFLEQSPIPSHVDWARSQLSLLFEMLAERDGRLFASVVNDYLAMGDPLVLSHPPMRELLAILGPDDAALLVERHEYANRDLWRLMLILSMPSVSLTGAHRETLLELLQHVPLDALPIRLWNVIERTDDDILLVVDVAKVLEARLETESSVSPDVVERLFHVDGASERLYREAPELFERLYLRASYFKKSVDHYAKWFNILQDQDPAFIDRYLETCRDRFGRYEDHRDYNAVWMRDDYTAVFNRVLAWQGDGRRRYDGQALSLFVKVSEKGAHEVWERQQRFIDEVIRNHADDGTLMQSLFELIAGWPEERRRGRVKTFLECNVSFEAFELLPLLPSGMSWSGSAVPVHRSRAAYLGSLLDLMTTSQFLEHRSHVEALVSSENLEAERHRQEDFARDISS